MRVSTCVLALFVTAGMAEMARAADCVILLHGLARTSRSMEKLESAFVARGFKVANVDYPSRSHDVASLAEIAIPKGLAACQDATQGQIHFVTHSLGGILIRYYLSRHRIPNLGRVVMLAPPNQGSEVVDTFGRVPGFNLLNGPAGSELGTAKGSVPMQLGPVDYPVGVIAGTRSINLVLSIALAKSNDGKVSLERTKVQGMSGFIALPVSHPFIMRNDLAIKNALAFIETGAFLPDAP
jgi:triacylglycerol lipase